MGYPTRVLAAIIAVAGAGAVAFGYLSFTVAGDQRSEIATVDRANVNTITDHVSGYGLRNGRWDGVQRIVSEVSDIADARIRLTTEAGVTLVDTDASAGVQPVAGSAIRISPRPQFSIRSGQEVNGPAIALSEIREFRRGAALAACLYATGIVAEAVSGQNGVPTLKPPADASAEVVQRATSQCPSATPNLDDLDADNAAIQRCFDPATSRVGSGCLGRVFAERTATVTADPVLLYVTDRRADAPVPITPLVGLMAAITILAATAAAVAGRSLFVEVSRASRRVAEGADVQVAEMSRYVDELTTSLQEKDELQRQRIAAVAHELRNPLANIRAYLEGLTDGIIQPQPELFASLHDEAMLQQRIIDDLRGDTAPQRAPAGGGRRLDLAELVKSAWTAQRQTAEAVGIRLTLDANGPLPVTGDADRLRQVLGNLLSNALRYTPSGGAVEIRTEQERGQAVVQVIDTGIGIAEEDLPRVFERQWRSEAARSLVADGSGLGLAITRQFVVDHGGAIFVDSRPGLGTAFTVVLPLLQPSEEVRS